MHFVKSILSERDMYSVEETQTVAEVANRMAALRVGAILVLRDGELRGIFSERDLMTRVVVQGLDVTLTPVAKVMTTDLATVGEDASIDEAMERMREVGCRHLPVLRKGRAVAGMVSMRDLMNLELQRKIEEINHMRAYIHGAS